MDKQGWPLHAAFFTGQIGFHDLLFVSELFYGLMIMQAVLKQANLLNHVTPKRQGLVSILLRFWYRRGMK